MHVLKSFSLENQVALVTGGAGLYGRQIVEALAEAGARTFMASRNLDKLEEYARELRERGLKVEALALDLADEKNIEAVMAEIVARAGTLDILVNNAVTRCATKAAPASGVQPGFSDWDQPMASFDASLHINASSLFCLTRLAATVMRAHGSGSIINVGSYMGLLGPNPTNYSESNEMNFSPIYFYEKGGMVNFTRYAASVLGNYGIRVNCINPGGFQTPGMSDYFVTHYSRNTMLGRLANATDLKGVIVFLASAASAYLTATNIPVDGGYVAK